MADKTIRTSTDLSDFRYRFRGRLEALARVQGLLSRLNEGDRVTLDELIRIKYGALAQPQGHLTVSWRVESPAAEFGWPLHIEWRESYVVMSSAQAEAQGSGMGRDLIERGLPFQFGARTTYTFGSRTDTTATILSRNLRLTRLASKLDGAAL